MPAAKKILRIDSEADARAAFAQDALKGLGAPQKFLPPKYFYDGRGSLLFEQITRTPEYYPTRTEIGILEENGDEIAQHIPAGAALVEFGSGSTAKIRTLLRALDKLEIYVPVDISAEFLEQEAASLRGDFPHLKVLPVAADFTRPFALPAAARPRPRAGFFPGSTIGNFEPLDARKFLRHAASVLGKGARLVIGVDLVKDESVLHAAYNDAAGVTASFNLNLLARLNGELGADFDPASFEHRALFNERRSRVEMHLVSRTRQQVKVCGRAFDFEAGESIHTECSYKYTLNSFSALAGSAGWTPLQSWTDEKDYFSVHALACN